MKNIVSRTKLGIIIAAAVSLAGMAGARPDNHVERIILVDSQSLGAGDQQAPVAKADETTEAQTTTPDPATPETASTAPTPATITIQAIEPAAKKKQAKPVT